MHKSEKGGIKKVARVRKKEMIRKKNRGSKRVKVRKRKVTKVIESVVEENVGLDFKNLCPKFLHIVAV